MPNLRIANIVGSITYQQELDLAELADTFRTREEITEVIYEPAENHWLQTRFAPQDTYVPFYRSGKCGIVGTSSEEEFYDTAERVNSVMLDLLEIDYEPEVKVSNIVSTFELEQNVNLESLAIYLGLEFVEYEPEQFPGLIYRQEDFVCLVFASGKAVLTGISDFDRIEEAVEAVEDELQDILTL